MSGLKGDDPRRALFVTLTAPGSDRLPDSRAIERWNLGASDRWEAFRRRLAHRFPGLTIEWARVYELQTRGALHVHVIVRGAYFIPQGLLVRLAVASGFGPIVDVRKVIEARGVSSYLGSYLAKSRRTFPKGARVFGASRGWRVGWVKRAPSPGRFVAGPRLGQSWGEWADGLIGRGYGLAAPRGPTEPRFGPWEPPPGLFD
jgi:hypothetical protein